MSGATKIREDPTDTQNWSALKYHKKEEITINKVLCFQTSSNSPV